MLKTPSVTISLQAASLAAARRASSSSRRAWSYTNNSAPLSRQPSIRLAWLKRSEQTRLPRARERGDRPHVGGVPGREQKSRLLLLKMGQPRFQPRVPGRMSDDKRTPPDPAPPSIAAFSAAATNRGSCGQAEIIVRGKVAASVRPSTSHHPRGCRKTVRRSRSEALFGKPLQICASSGEVSQT